MTAPVKRIEIDYRPRKWARPFHASMARWFALVLHRRAGKTTGVLNHHIRAATNDRWESTRLRHLMPEATDQQIKDLLRVRLYGHILPLRTQAKLAAWDMLKYYASFVPGASTNESELRVDFPCPAGHVRRVQLFGADNLDSLRGGAFAGMSLDEFGQHPPTGFGEVLSKALADHLGYCIWAGTIKGKNQLWKVWDAARKSSDWFHLWQDVDASLAQEDDAAISAIRRAMADDRVLVEQGVMTQEEYDQEWYLSTEASIKGAYYAKQIAQARRDGRIGTVPYDAMLPVETTWDLGVSDKTTIWLSQSLRSGEIRLIDYYEAEGEGLQHYINVLHDRSRERGYVYGDHWAPHDINVRELGTGKSRIETARALGLKFKVVPQLPVKDGIDAARALLSRCWFDETRCEVGIEALTQYRKGWDDKLQQFRDTAVHDWSSHGADAFRYLAVRHKTPEDAKPPSRYDGWSDTGSTPSGQGWMAL